MFVVANQTSLFGNFRPNESLNAFDRDQSTIANLGSDQFTFLHQLINLSATQPCGLHGLRD